MLVSDSRFLLHLSLVASYYATVNPSGSDGDYTDGNKLIFIILLNLLLQDIF